MKSKPNNLISIIVPVYNVEKYLEKCIKSIVSQTYKNLEIILVNDGSTDNSGKICDKLAKTDKRIKIIHKKNEGVSSARNFGLNKATGKYIMFVDADDYLSSDCIKYMYDLIVKTNSEFSFSKYCYKVKSDKQNIDFIEVYTPAQATAYLLSMKIDVGCWNKIYKKELLDNNNIRFSENLFYGEGLEFITRVAQRATRIGVGSRRVYYYRQNNINSATTYFNIKKYINGEKSLKVIKETLILDDLCIKRELNIHFCMFYINAIIDVLLNDKEKAYKSEYKYWKKMIRKLSLKIIFYKEINFKMKLKIIIACLCPILIVTIKKKNDKRIYSNSVD